MAFLLFKFVRRKIRENNAKKTISTTDDSHLIPETNPGHELNHRPHKNPDENTLAGIETPPESCIDSVSAEEAAQRKAEARRRTIRQWKLMIGLALPNFLASVDVTIVAPAIPLISSHFSMLNPTTLQRSGVLIQHSRPLFKQFQLDRRRLHFDIYHLRSSLWTTC
jgi:hypothetical protein